jgi:ornithine cyclodeaminase/alanine dehydrogenase-like protein (mu-crystallin family)
VLSRADIADLLTPADYLAAIEGAFRAEGSGATAAPAPLHLDGVGGAFHAKGAALHSPDGRSFVAVKVNGNFPGNPNRHGLPTIQGVIVLSDARTGAPLAILDSIEITIRRTAAATALAAQHLARADARTLTLVGCGAQAAAQIEAVMGVRKLDGVFVFDIEAGKAARFAEVMSSRLSMPVTTAASLREATRASALIVTCTTATTPILGPDDVAPGAFVAAVGADAPHKNEIEPALMNRAKIVVDSLAQCRDMGDLRHLHAARLSPRAAVHASLADIVSGARPGREGDEEITLFDSTGTAIQDVASAVRAWEEAVAAGRGRRVELNG